VNDGSIFIFSVGVALATWLAARTAANAAGLDAGPTPRLPLIIASAIATWAAHDRHDSAGPLLAAAIVGVTACAIGDQRTGYLFDRAIVVLSAVLITLAAIGGNLGSALIAGTIVASPLLMLYAITGGRGLGLGDVKLAFPIGVGLGALAGLGALGAAFIAGGTLGVVLLARGCARTSAIRFGPFLAFGTAASALVPIAAVLH
jgi:prepilin signal peptidase PulO-like enzyme (type II secretory pathway)